MARLDVVCHLILQNLPVAVRFLRSCINKPLLIVIRFTDCIVTFLILLRLNCTTGLCFQNLGTAEVEVGIVQICVSVIINRFLPVLAELWQTFVI